MSDAISISIHILLPHNVLTNTELKNMTLNFKKRSGLEITTRNTICNKTTGNTISILKHYHCKKQLLFEKNKIATKTFEITLNIFFFKKQI